MVPLSVSMVAVFMKPSMGERGRLPLPYFPPTLRRTVIQRSPSRVVPITCHFPVRRASLRRSMPSLHPPSAPPPPPPAGRPPPRAEPRHLRARAVGGGEEDPIPAPQHADAVDEVLPALLPGPDHAEFRRGARGGI